MKYAVVQLGGKQVKIEEGDVFEIERQSKLDMPVLLFSDGKEVQIGTPTLSDVEVKAKIVEDKLDKKVVVARYKSKSRYRKNKGHRQPISVVRIESIGKKSSKPASKPETKKKEDAKVKPKSNAKPKKPVKKVVKEAKK